MSADRIVTRIWFIVSEKTKTISLFTPRQRDLALVFISAVAFYLSSVFVSFGHDTTRLTAGYFTTARALFGLIILLTMTVLHKNRNITAPDEYRFLTIRAVGNFIALYFYLEVTARVGPALGNTLNLTYPLFLVLFSFFGNRNERRLGTAISAFVAFFGVLLILRPTGTDWDPTAGLLGLASGFAAAISVASLRETRKHNSPETILFSLFFLGFVLSLISFRNEIFMPDGREFWLLTASSVFGAVGQYYITLGALHISAVESGVVSLSRILMAVLIGPLLGVEPFQSFWTCVGALLIFGANVYLALQRPRRATAVLVNNQ